MYCCLRIRQIDRLVIEYFEITIQHYGVQTPRSSLNFVIFIYTIEHLMKVLKVLVSVLTTHV